MIPSKNHHLTTIATGTPDDLHLSGLLTGYDPTKSACGLSDRRSRLLRSNSTAARATVNSRPAVGVREIPPADPLMELAMLSAQASRGGIGAMPRAPSGRRMPMDAISVLVVILATAIGVFLCRKPLQNMAFFGHPRIVHVAAAYDRAKSPLPRQTHKASPADSTFNWWKVPAACAPTAPPPIQAPAGAHPAVSASANVTEDNSKSRSDNIFKNPPGALFTHVGNSQ